MNPEQLKKEAYKNAKDFKKKIASLKKEKDGKLDSRINDLNDKAFAHIDCLSCANCCKTLGPLFNQKDVERVAKHLKMKPGAFTEKYLRIDEDNDYVLKETPCSFLDSENYCTIYDVRPKACADYPNTHLRNQKTMLNLLQKNTEYCPAVFEIVEKL
jgi:Fe-S-cluster containining protein